MFMTESINLIRLKPGIPGYLGGIARPLRRGSFILFGVTVFGGMIVGLATLIIGDQYRRLVTAKDQYTKTISNNKTREELIVGIRQRLAVIEKARAMQYAWSSVLDHLATIASAASIRSLSTDDKQTVLLTVDAHTTKDAQAIVDAVLEQYMDKTIAKPQLVSLTVDKDGQYTMTLSLVPLFTETQ